MCIISNEIKFGCICFSLNLSLGPQGHGPIIESGSVGQKQHLYSLQRLTTTSPSLPLSCHNTIKGTVRFGGREHPLGSLLHGLTSKWKPTRSSTDTCTHPDRQTEPCVDPAAWLWFADFVLRWTTCWCITCLPTVFFSFRLHRGLTSTPFWFPYDTPPSSSSSSLPERSCSSFSC